jgi:hypothetical protein
MNSRKGGKENGRKQKKTFKLKISGISHSSGGVAFGILHTRHCGK